MSRAEASPLHSEARNRPRYSRRKEGRKGQLGGQSMMTVAFFRALRPARSRSGGKEKIRGRRRVQASGHFATAWWRCARPVGRAPRKKTGAKRELAGAFSFVARESVELETSTFSPSFSPPPSLAPSDQRVFDIRGKVATMIFTSPSPRFSALETRNTD